MTARVAFFFYKVVIVLFFLRVHTLHYINFVTVCELKHVCVHVLVHVCGESWNQSQRHVHTMQSLHNLGCWVLGKLILSGFGQSILLS